MRSRMYGGTMPVLPLLVLGVTSAALGVRGVGASVEVDCGFVSGAVVLSGVVVTLGALSGASCVVVFVTVEAARGAASASPPSSAATPIPIHHCVFITAPPWFSAPTFR